MTQDQKLQLCGFFNHTIGRIPQLEENVIRANCADNLSVKELYVLNAVAELTAAESNTMANTARVLGVSPGSLSTAVNVLVNKGYIERHYSVTDRRVINIFLTESGRKVCDIYRRHVEMISEKAAENTDEKTLDSIIAFLNSLTDVIAESENN